MKKEKNDRKARRSYYTGKIVRSLLLLAFGELIFLAGLSDYRTESDLEAVFIFAFIVIGIALCNTLKYEKLRLGLDGAPKDKDKEKDEKISEGGGKAPEIPEKAAGAGDKAAASFEVTKSGGAKVFIAAAVVTAVVNAAAVIYLIRM